MRLIDHSDDDFERALRGSASRDTPDAEATARAWSRFAALLAGVGAGAGGVAGPVSRSPAGGRFNGAIAAAKWAVVGALGGSALTFALVGRRPDAAPTPTASPAAHSSARSSALVAANPDTEGLEAEGPDAEGRAPVASDPGAASAPSTSRLPVFDQSAGQIPKGQIPNGQRSRALRPSAAPRGEASTLAAEVAALDAARGALDVGTPDAATALLRRYLRDFPDGTLLPEAEAMAIEALDAKGDRAGVIRDAQRFLERYPSAPQRARVEQLAEAARK